MGLDQYLYRKSYVQNWDHIKPDYRYEITIKRGGKVCEDIKPARIAYIIEQVAYWRKANAIHKFFVDECQGGIDDCREAYVEIEKLQELVTACKKVLETVETVDGKLHSGTSYHRSEETGEFIQEEHYEDGKIVAQQQIAESILPTQSGFFFGSTEYTEWYLQDLRKTVEQIEPLLTESGDGDFYYHSSW